MAETSTSMSVMDAINLRRSVRAYQDAPLDRDTINALLAAAVRAPTAIHEEQWVFAVVQGRAELAKLSAAIRAPLVIEGEQAVPASHVLHRPPDGEFNFFYDADTLILICAVPMGPYVTADCWLAAENLMLAACAMGLGSCVIGSAAPGLNQPHIKAELGIPEEINIVAPIIVGVPRADAQPTQRTPAKVISWKGGAQ